MSSIKTIALAGATGRVGAPVLQALLDAGFSVTVLTRPSSNHSFPASVKVSKMDYDDLASLTEALKGHDALISTLGMAGLSQQNNLVDAAVAAGVKRIIPSEFGSNLDNPRARELPVFATKLQTQEHLEQAVRGTQTTYTYVLTNAFLDFCIAVNFIVNVAEKKMEILDGGDTKTSMAPLQFVAKGVVAVLKHPEETANRSVRLHGLSTTQNKLLSLVQKYAGKEGWQITHSTVNDVRKRSYDIVQADPANMGGMMGLVTCAIYGKDYGADFSQDNDNALLGLKELSQQEVEDVVKASVEQAS